MLKPQEVYAALAANAQTLEIPVDGLSVLAIQVVGAMSATIQFEGTINGTDFFALNSLPRNSSSVVTSATAAGVWFANVAGLKSARIRCSAYTSGTPTMILRATEEGIPTPAGVGTGGGAATIADGADVNAGTTTDAAVVSDANGTMSSKLRGLVKIFADLWDSTNHKLITAMSVDKLYSGLTALTPKYAFLNQTASGTNQTLVAAVTSKKIRVLAAYALPGSTATDLTFNSATAGAISAKFANGANGGEVLPFCPVGWFETVAGEALAVTTGAGATTGIGVVYVEV